MTNKASSRFSIWTFVLISSLIVNLFFVGFFVGRLYLKSPKEISRYSPDYQQNYGRDRTHEKYKDHGKHFQKPFRGPKGETWGLLNHKGRKAFRSYLKTKHKRVPQELLIGIAQNWRIIAQVFKAEPFNEQKAKRTFEKNREITTQIQGKLQMDMLLFWKSLTSKERQSYLTSVFPKKDHKKSHK